MSKEVRFVPAERLLRCEGDFSDIIKFITEGLWDDPDRDALAVHALFNDGWYLFERRLFGRRAREFSDLPGSQQTLDNFKDIFDMHEKRRVPVVRPGEAAAEPAVVLAVNRVLEGAWMERGPHTSRAKPPTRGVEKAGLIDVVSQPADDSLRRTPHMKFTPEPPVTPEGEFNTEVFADDAAPALGEESEPIVLPDSSDAFWLSVWLSRSAELEVLGPNELPLRIHQGEARSSSAHFRVKVLADAPVGKLARLTASFSYRGRPCGRVTRSVLIGPPGTVPVAGEEALKPDYPGGVRIESEPPRPADLTVVVACPDGEADRYEVKVTTPLLDEFKLGVTRPWKLRSATGDLVRAMLSKFTEGGISNERRLDRLVAAGRDLFDIAPEHFRDAFWKLIRGKAPLRSIYVVSEEPHIAWELMVPVPAPADDDGRRWKPLGVEFAIGRWVHEGHTSPPGAVSLSRACVLAPDYSGSQRAVLQNSAAESDYVRQHFSGTVFTPARYSEIRARVGAEMAPLFHFVGHGSITDDQSDEQFCLEADETLSATETRGMDGFRAGLRKERPMVFLNACEVGRPIPALVGAGGFPRTFVLLGASAVIAPLWSVRDGCAHKVAVSLYDAIREASRLGKAPQPVAEILRGIRSRAYAGEDAGEDSFAAYCFYGDPSFVIRLP